MACCATRYIADSGDGRSFYETALHVSFGGQLGRVADYPFSHVDVLVRDQLDAILDDAVDGDARRHLDPAARADRAVNPRVPPRLCLECARHILLHGNNGAYAQDLIDDDGAAIQFGQHDPLLTVLLDAHIRPRHKHRRLSFRRFERSARDRPSRLWHAGRGYLGEHIVGGHTMLASYRSSTCTTPSTPCSNAR